MWEVDWPRLPVHEQQQVTSTTAQPPPVYFPCLTSLVLNCCQLTDELLEGLAATVRLRRLSLSLIDLAHESITAAGLDALLSPSSLCFLSLE